jgi:hypothetical protein
LTKDEEDDPDYQHDNADRPQNADAQDPAQDQQDETKNNHVILLVLFYPGMHCLTQQVADASLAAEPAAIDTTSEPGDRKGRGRPVTTGRAAQEVTPHFSSALQYVGRDAKWGVNRKERGKY